MRFTPKFFACCVFAILIVSTESVRAVPVIFTINQSTSSIQLSGTSPLAGSASPQSAGSDTTTAVGNFRVELDDPTNPTSITFVPGVGYAQLQYTGNGASFLPGSATSNLPPAPANFAMQAQAGAIKFAGRNISFDFGAPATPVANKAFSTANLTVSPRSGEYDYNDNFFGLGLGSFDVTTALAGNKLTGGLTSPSAGNLALSLSGQLPYSIPGFLQGAYTGTLNATAAFGSANMATAGASSTANVLGGTSTKGGVAAQFGSGATGGTFSAQIIPIAGLPFASLNGLHGFGIDPTRTQNAQVWEVDYSGAINGPLTLTFRYDVAKLTQDQRAHEDSNHIKMNHWNSSASHWDTLPGTVNPGNHTITVTTNSLSPFLLDAPEPSTWLLGVLGAVALIAFGLTRRGARMRG